MSSPTPRLGFFDLPKELRLEIYDLLLLCPDPIIVSPRRRQLRVRRELATNRNTYLRAPPPQNKLVKLEHRRPHVQLLRVSRRVNEEATPVLYGRNEFLVGVTVAKPDPDGKDPAAQLANFFPWALRRSTMLEIASLTFQAACMCDSWLCKRGIPFPVPEWPTRGVALAKMCFETRPDGGHLLPAPKQARDALAKTRLQLSGGGGHQPVFSSCASCRKNYGCLYII